MHTLKLTELRRPYHQLRVIQLFSVYLIASACISLVLALQLDGSSQTAWLLESGVSCMIAITLFRTNIHRLQKSAKWSLLIWFVMQLSFGYFIVDDNLIGTIINFHLIGILALVSYCCRWKITIGALFIVTADNVIRLALITQEIIHPIVYSSVAWTEMLQLQLLMGLLLSLAWLNDSFSSLILRLLHRRKQRIVNINVQLAQINEESVHEINAFKAFIHSRSRQLLRLLKESKRLLDEHKAHYDLKLRDRIQSIYMDMDYMIRQIERRANGQLNKDIKPKSLNATALLDLLENLKSMHDRSFLMYVSLCTIIAESILMPQAAYPILSMIIVGFAVLMSILYAFYECQPHISSSLGFGLLAAMLLFLHLQMSSTNGMAPVIQVAEGMLSIYLIFRFGWKQTLWIGISFILYSVSIMWFIQSGRWDPIMRFDPHPMALVGFFAIAAISFVLLARFSVTRNRLMQDQLDIMQQQAQNRRRELSSTYKMHKKKLDQITSISSTNSHELRAPIARMIGLLNIVSDPSDQSFSKDEFENLIANSLNEAESVVFDLKAIAH